ncbi:MAG: TonB family protein [Acidobacteria bacterium]|nr:TonB family protein [Acidobacteriota bacterium]
MNASHSVFVPDLAARAQETTAPAARPGETRKSVQDSLQAVSGEGAKDPEAWLRLGVAHGDAGDAGAALKAFRQAFKLRPDFVAARAGAAYTLFTQGKLKEAEKEAVQATRRVRNQDDYVAYTVSAMIQTERQGLEAAREMEKAERELAKKPNDARWHMRRALALLVDTPPERRALPFGVFLGDSRPRLPDEGKRQAARESTRKRYEEAAASFEKYLSLKPRAGDREFVLGQLEALRFYARGADARGEKIFSNSEVETKALILSKPEPGFTEEARNAGETGVVRLRAVLAADGGVKYILILRSLRHGLTERAVAAARRIRFRPAVVGGAPVSQYVILEYNFNIY